jgi:magnesium-transporting ATPase (P-type)
VIVHQFRSPLIYLLLVAAAIAVVIGERSDAIVISIVVLLDAAIGAIQEPTLGWSKARRSRSPRRR